MNLYPLYTRIPITSHCIPLLCTYIYIYIYNYIYPTVVGEIPCNVTLAILPPSMGLKGFPRSQTPYFDESHPFWSDTPTFGQQNL